MNILSHPFSASLDLLNILIKYASHLGIDEPSLIAESGVDIQAYRKSETRIPIHDFHPVWSLALNRSGDPDFGLHLSEQSHEWLKGHLIYAMMMNSENLAQAIEKCFQYHNLLIDIIQPSLEIKSPDAHLTFGLGHPALATERHIIESMVAMVASMLQFLSSNEIELTEVRFSHPGPENTAEHERIFQAPLTFGRKHNEIIMPEKYLDIRVFFSNPAIMIGLEELAQKALNRSYASNSWKEKVARILFKALLRGKKNDIESIASRLATTTRNLQLKLKQEDTSFRKLNDEVRKEIAIGYLNEENDSIVEISLLLGFADQSAFHHAFKRWTGRTPGEYRRRLNGNGAGMADVL